VRTLVVAINLPYPTFGGMDLRNWQNVNGLAAVGEVGIFGLCSNDPRGATRSPVGVAFQVCSVDPRLSNPPPRDIKIEARAWLTRPLGHPCDYLYSENAADELSTLLQSFEPQAVLLEGIWPHRYIDVIERYPCQIILDCHNVEAVVAQQIGQSIDGNDLRAKLWRFLLPERMRKVEHEATRRADQIWVCSEEDAALIKDFYHPTAKIFVIPNSIDVGNYGEIRGTRDLMPSKMKKTVIFPGAFGYQPNVNAARFLIDKVFPRLVNVFPDLEILLVGRNATPEMAEAAKHEPRIVVTGEVADVRPYLARASLTLVPLFEGSGTRFKLLEAFAAGLPVVSTAQGAAGLGVRDGTHLLIAEKPDEFVDAAKLLWDNEGLAKNLADNALEFVQRNYSWSRAHHLIKQALERLRGIDHNQAQADS
jgi:polysaccharide biosynthesis protein PslH